MSRITQRAAIAALRKIFVDSDKDILTLDEIFDVVGRDPRQPESNRRWLQNRLTTLRYYEFVAPIYTKYTTSSNPHRKLVKVQLTPTGKTALTSEVSSRAITLESIARDIKAIERQNPSIALDFTVRVRRDN
jgi:hypothetical protein